MYLYFFNRWWQPNIQLICKMLRPILFRFPGIWFMAFFKAKLSYISKY